MKAFTVNYVSYEESFKEIKNVQTATTTQQADTLAKILKKKNSKIFAHFHENIN